MGETPVQKDKHDQCGDKDEDQMGDHELVFEFHIVQKIVHGGGMFFLHVKPSCSRYSEGDIPTCFLNVFPK